MTAHRVTRGFAWNHLYKMVEYGGLNLYTILVVRKFGPEIGGNYAVYLSISGTLAILSAFAVDGVLLRYLPRIARGESQIGTSKIEGIRPFLLQLFAFRLLVTTVLSALVMLVLGVLPSFIPSLGASLGSIGRLWPYFVIFLFGQAGVAFGTFTMIGLLQVRWVFFASLTTRFSVLAVGLVLILTSTLTLENAVALSAVAAVLNAMLLLYWVNRHVHRESSVGLRKEAAAFAGYVMTFIRKPGYLRVFIVMPFMLYGITTWGSDVLGTVLGRQPDILMMRAMLGENARDIGLYESAARLVLATEYIFLLGLGGTLVSVFSELVHRDEAELGIRNEELGMRKDSLIPEENIPNSSFLIPNSETIPNSSFLIPNSENIPNSRTYPRLLAARREIAGFQSVSTAPVFAFMLVFAPLVIQAIYGYRFAGAAPMIVAGLSILLVAVIVFGGGMQITSLVVIGKERAVFKNRLTWGILNLIANYFLIKGYGGLGAMIGTQLANAGACMVESYLAYKWIGPSFSVSHTARILAIVSVAIAITYYGVSLLPPATPALLRVSIGGIVAALLTIAGYTVFKVPEAKKVFDRLRGLLRRESLEPIV